MAKRAIVLLSGGMDSSVLLSHMKFEDYEVTALSVDYGQRHERELASAQAIAEAASVPLVRLELAVALAPIFMHSKSSQVNSDIAVPHGHYAAESMKTTIVPNRNMLLLSLAGALAESVRGQEEACVIAYAAHAGDHAIYPDCRPSFYGACNRTIEEATDYWVKLYAPFGNITKTDIAKRGAQLGVPFELTYSCYEGRDLHCGLCGTCVERKEAFKDAGIADPTRYEV
jgi:7-cyano-7-deazaguanine synthase